ncbi:hypothetical protein F4703DRAFT_1218717 [Phycomyces blakesleeanus]
MTVDYWLFDLANLWFGLVWSGLVCFGLAWPGLVLSGLVWFDSIRFDLIFLFGLVWPGLVRLFLSSPPFSLSPPPVQVIIPSSSNPPFDLYFLYLSPTYTQYVYSIFNTISIIYNLYLYILSLEY